MEIQQPLDFSAPGQQRNMSVLDLCVRSSSHSPTSSPSNSPLYHPYNNNNNNNNSKSYNNNNDIHQQLEQQHQQLMLRMELEQRSSPPSSMELPLPALSMLQQQLLPRSPASAFGPAPRRRRTSSGLPDSPPGSSDERSELGSSGSPPLDLLVPSGAAFHSLAGAMPPSSLPAGLPASPSGALSIPQQVISAGSSRSGKPTRPFKAYPKDPLSLTAGVPGVGVSAAEVALGRASNEAYAEFRRRMLAQVQAATGSKQPQQSLQRRAPSPTPSTSPSPSPTLLAASQDAAADSTNPASSPESCGAGPHASKDGKDAAYWERRRKNNEAAKRSRDARRAKEDEIAIRAAFLEQENMKLKYEVAALRNETAKLRCMLYSGAN